MSEYYAVQRSTDYLVHYGVKGMRWGVRKAIEKGNSKALARQYNRAAKKLAKLNNRADVEVQAKNAKKYNRIAKVSSLIGGAGLATLGALKGTEHATTHLNEIATKKAAQSHEAYRNALYNDNYHSADMYYDLYRAANDRAHKYWRTNLNAYNALSAYAAPLGVGTAAGFGTAAIAKGKAIAAKRRTTAQGHAKAVAKRDAWQKEMKSAFKGTQYDASGSVKTKKRRRK